MSTICSWMAAGSSIHFYLWIFMQCLLYINHESNFCHSLYQGICLWGHFSLSAFIQACIVAHGVCWVIVMLKVFCDHINLGTTDPREKLGFSPFSKHVPQVALPEGSKLRSWVPVRTHQDVSRIPFTDSYENLDTHYNCAPESVICSSNLLMEEG